MLKIQTKAIDLPNHWQDLENMPELPTREDAEAWLEQPALQTLKELGFEFQIVPA